MSTNYFVTQGPCLPYGHDHQWLMCTSRATWKAYRPDFDGTCADAPTGQPIESFADWRALLETGEWQIVDIYGDRHDPAEFLASVTIPDDTTDRVNRWSDIYYQDADGYLMCETLA